MRCEATRPNGERCRALVLPGKALCWCHDPEMQARAAEARRTGGENSSNAAKLARRVPKDMQALAKRLLEAVDEVHRGDLDHRRATAMASLASAAVRVFEVGELQGRLEALEAAAEQSPRRGA